MEHVKNNFIITQTEHFVKVCGGMQKAFFEKQLKDFHEVRCVSISDVFSKDEMRLIKSVVKPKKKECYRNAHLLTLLFKDRVKYVEGKVAICGGVLGIDHAWNKVGDKYIDVTFEMVLNNDPTKELYMSLGEYDLETITSITSETGYYGGIYNQLFINQNREKL